jgi:hypothetical protein
VLFHIPDNCISLIIIVEYFVCDLPYDLYLPDMHCVRYLFPLNLFPGKQKFLGPPLDEKEKSGAPVRLLRPPLAKGHEVGD